MDLPIGIGKPAERAVVAGYTELERLTRVRRDMAHGGNVAQILPDR
jgi:hypothetical protein